jgi:predicted transposase/invertase (TIGR01784 family)
MCKLNPKIDLVFKKIFGTEQNKNVLKSLINSILPQEEQVVELTIKNPYNEADFVGDKLSVVDIKATDEKGRWYDIEIQIKEQKYYGKRAIFYHSEIYGNQLGEGDSYDKLRKTIIISILDFDYFLKDKRYFRRCCYKDFETGELYPELDYADLYFVELRKFNNEYKNITTTLERWITFLNKATEYDKNTLPSELREPEIIQAFNTIETMNLTTQERDYYQSAKKVMRDRAAELLTAVENAVENAVDSRNMEIAKSLKLKNVSIEIIIETTGLTQEQIEKL